MQIPIQNDIVGEAKLIVQEIAKILSVHRRLPVDLDNSQWLSILNKSLLF